MHTAEENKHSLTESVCLPLFLMKGIPGVRGSPGLSGTPGVEVRQSYNRTNQLICVATDYSGFFPRDHVGFRDTKGSKEVQVFW